MVNSFSPSTDAFEMADTPLTYVDLQRDSLGYAIKRAQVRSYDVLFSVMGPESLTPGRMTALSIVATQPGINQTVLADMLGITRAGAVKVIDSLEALGYVERNTMPDDRRSYALGVTQKGLDELKRLNVLNREFEKRIAQRLSSDERQMLMSLLERVAVD
ncbi:MarR family winged helix-turn-helix transcriptional regulator [Neopusillimonas maritima]|nr:MarR family transcriptional regulator [Neopusillimonas maritima]